MSNELLTIPVHVAAQLDYARLCAYLVQDVKILYGDLSSLRRRRHDGSHANHRSCF